MPGRPRSQPARRNNRGGLSSGRARVPPSRASTPARGPRRPRNGPFPGPGDARSDETEPDDVKHHDASGGPARPTEVFPVGGREPSGVMGQAIEPEEDRDRAENRHDRDSGGRGPRRTARSRSAPGPSTPQRERPRPGARRRLPPTGPSSSRRTRRYRRRTRSLSRPGRRRRPGWPGRAPDREPGANRSHGECPGAAAGPPRCFGGCPIDPDR